MRRHWINSDSRLQSLVADLREEPLFGLDTEFIRTDTYYPDLALIQIARQDDIYLIDAPALPHLNALGAIFTTSSPLKILHSAGEDLIALRPLMDAPFQNLFDTQIAAAFAGLGPGMGYQALVARLLEIPLAKSQTLSDWRRRPLSETQLQYAAQDVEHLRQVHDRLATLLERRNMRAWFEDECRAALRGKQTEPLHDFRNVWHWPLARQAKLKALLGWRESIAEQIDRPRGWVIGNPMLTELAADPPTTVEALATMLAKEKYFPKEKLRELLVLLHETADENIVPIPPPLPEDKRRRLHALRTEVATLAEKLDLPPALLCSKSLCEALINGEALPELQGWRREALAELIERYGQDGVEASSAA